MTLATYACADDGGSVDGGTGDDTTGNGDGADDGTPPTTADDGDDDDGGATTDGGDDGMPMTDDGADGTTDDGADETTDDGGDTTDGGGDGGVCVQGCVEDSDCCPPGAIGCPSEDYPNNWTCEDGACAFGGCDLKDKDFADCDDPLNPLDDGMQCLPVEGVGACVTPCAVDDNCQGLLGGDAECVGMTDDGDGYCTLPPPEPCADDTDCEDNAAGPICDNGTCVCTGEKDCDQGDVCQM